MERKCMECWLLKHSRTNGGLLIAMVVIAIWKLYPYLFFCFLHCLNNPFTEKSQTEKMNISLRKMGILFPTMATMQVVLPAPSPHTRKHNSQFQVLFSSWTSSLSLLLAEILCNSGWDSVATRGLSLVTYCGPESPLCSPGRCTLLHYDLLPSCLLSSRSWKSEIEHTKTHRQLHTS